MNDIQTTASPASTAFIHPTSLVEPGAVLGAGVRIGPFCTIGAQARIGDGAHLMSHVVIDGESQSSAGQFLEGGKRADLPPSCGPGSQIAPFRKAHGLRRASRPPR